MGCGDSHRCYRNGIEPLMERIERWIAVRGRQFRDIREALRASSARQLASRKEYFEERSDTRRNAAGAVVDGRVYGFQNDDWYILLMGRNNWHSVAGGDAVSLRLSEENGEVVNTGVGLDYERSDARFYRNNEKLWSIIHDANKGQYHLQTSGKLPDCYERIKNIVLDPSLPEPPKDDFRSLGRKHDRKKYRESAVEVPLRVSRALTDYTWSMGVTENDIIHCFELG